MRNNIFLDACKGKNKGHIPVWYMRQAGRCIPAYRKIREKYDVLTITKTPELATEVAMQPVEAFDVDAAILFADIMVPLTFMGIDVDIVDSVGPVIHNPIRDVKDITRNMHHHDIDADYAYLRETIASIKKRLPTYKAVIGFCGAPFTLASYIIEGKPTREFVLTKRFMYEQPKAWHMLMEKLTEEMIVYLKEQVKAGIDAYQVFDSWIGYVSTHDYIAYVLPYSKKIFAALKDSGIPGIHFGTNTAHLLKEFASVDCDVVGLDWRISLPEARGIIDPQKSLQGNLDPVVLLSNPAVIKQKAGEILDSVSRREGYIFNLGHGILPETPMENIITLTNYIHETY